MGAEGTSLRTMTAVLVQHRLMELAVRRAGRRKGLRIPFR